MKLNPQSLAIHRLDSKNFSDKDKQLLLDVLKAEYKYEKDESATWAKAQARKKHAKKREILAELEAQWINPSRIELIKWDLYPDYNSSQDSSEIKEGIDPVTWQEIQDFAHNNTYTIQWEELEKIKNIPFTKETLPGGIKKFTLNGKVFTSMSWDKYKFGAFIYRNLNKDPDNYTKWRSLGEFNKNPSYQKLLTESWAQPFEDINELCTFHCSLLQDIADELKMNINITSEFLDNSSNDNIINNLMTYLRTLTGENIVIPYKIDPDTNLVSSLDCSSFNRWVFRVISSGISRFSFFSKVGASHST
jgi:hypothetical protein